MYFLYTLLQAVNRDVDADLDDPDAIDELRVVSIEVATQMVTDDKVIQVFSISNKLLRTENRTLWYRTVNSVGLTSLQTLLNVLIRHPLNDS